MKKLHVLILLTVIVATASLAISSQDLIDIRKLLTREQQQSAGLHKLSSAEMDMLYAPSYDQQAVIETQT